MAMWRQKGRHNTGELLAATIASDPAMDGEHNRVVRVWLCGGNKEGTRQELLAATHCIRPSDGWGT